MRDRVRRDQTLADARQALVAPLIEGDTGGVSKRRIPEILATVKAELLRTV